MPTKFPPGISLNTAIKAIQDIHQTHSKERFNVDHLVDFLDTTKTSSNFASRVSALQGFGLLEKSGDTAQLTDLAIQIIQPVAGEDKEAKLTAFRKNDVLSDLLTRYYPNAKLPPEPETLKSVLLKSIGINRDTIQKWYDFVVDSFKAIAGTTGKVDETSKPEAEPQKQRASTTQDDNSEMKMSVVYLPSGRKFQIGMQDGYTTEDLEFAANMMGLFLKGQPTRPPKVRKEKE